MSPEAFQNSENLWGFKIGNFMTVKPKYREIQNYKNGLACVKIASWGCIDLLGKKIIPFQYSDMKLTNECVIACNRQKCWGTLDYQGNSTIPFEYIELEIFEDGYLKVNKNHKWGILDIQGNIIIPFEYNKLIPFTEETIKAAKGHGYFDDVKWGILDKSGGVIIPFEYDEIVKFKDENTKLRKDSLWEEIDSDWNYIISNISTLSNGLKKGRRFDKWAILNIENKAISSFEFNDINSFNDDYIMALKGKWGILDIQGNIIIPFEYNELIPFTEETIKAAKEHGYFHNVKWGILDKSGGVIIPFEYDEIVKFKDENTKLRKDSLWEEIDSDWNYIISNISTLSNGLKKGRRFDKWAILNIENKAISSFEFNDINSFNDDYIMALKGKWGILDIQGNIIIPFEYNELIPFTEETIKAAKGHGYFDDVKWGILDKSGDVIIPFEFNDIEEFEDGYLKVRKNYKWGILDKSGGVIIPFEYDEIVKFKDENTKLRKDSFKEMIRGRKGMFWKTILLASKISLGEKHEGVITDILSFGLIVKIKNYTTGLLHITEIRKKGWNIRDFKIGDTINVQVISLDNNKLRFTLEVIPFIVGEKHAGTIINIKPFGLFVKVKGHEVGLVHKTEISKSMKSIQDFRVGDIITVKVKYVDKEKNKANFGIVL